MNLKEFRQKYPMYDDLSDQQVADKLHSTYYPDIPKQEFYNKFGFQSQPEMSFMEKVLKSQHPYLHGAKEVGKDIAGSLANAPGKAWEGIKNIPEFLGEAKSGIGQVVTDPVRAIQNIMGGVAGAGRGAVNMAPNVAEYLAKKGILNPQVSQFMSKLKSPITDVNIPEALGRKGKKPGDVFLEKSAEFLPYGIGGGATTLGATTGLMSHAVGQNEDPLQAAIFGNAIMHGVPLAARGGRRALTATAPENIINRIRNAREGNFNREMGEIIREGEEHGVPVFPADLYQQPNIITGTSKLAEKVPVINTVGARLEQNVAAREAAQNFAAQQAKRMNETQFGNGLERIRQVAAGDSRRAPQAQRILNDIGNAGEDWNRIIQTSGNVSLFTKKLRADELSNRVTRMANEFGNVPEIHTQRTINQSIQRINNERLPDQGTLRILEQIQEELGRPTNYEGLRSFRRNLSDRITDYYSGKNAVIGAQGVEYLQSINNSIDRDMRDFARNHSPELRNSFEQFNRYYERELVPYKDAQLAKALKSADPDDIYAAFIKRSEFEHGKGHGRAQRFYNALDEKGRKAVKYGLIQHSVEKAIKPDGTFSPAQFSLNLERNMPARRFFQGEEHQQLNRFINLMRRVERSGQMKPPETGVQAIPYIIGAAAVADPLSTAIAAGAALFVRRLATSENVTRYLAASPERIP